MGSGGLGAGKARDRVGREVELAVAEADCKADREAWGGALRDWLAVLLADALPPLVPVALKDGRLEVVPVALKDGRLEVEREAVAEAEAVEVICAAIVGNEREARR